MLLGRCRSTKACDEASHIEVLMTGAAVKRTVEANAKPDIATAPGDLLAVLDTACLLTGTLLRLLRGAEPDFDVTSVCPP